MTEPLVPEARAYTHEGCSQETIVSGEAFEAVSDPLSDMDRTWCEACIDFFPLSEFAWSDTGEKISDYYARHGATATNLQRFLCSRLFLIIAVAIGGLLGIATALVFFRGEDWLTLMIMVFTLGVVGVILFGSLKEFVLGPFIVRKVCGVKDTRMLQ